MKNFIFIFLLLSINLFSQIKDENVFGNISDANTKQSLSNISISIENTDIFDITDKYGNYCLNVPVGQYTVIIKSDIYPTTTITNLEIKNGERKRIDIFLVNE